MPINRHCKLADGTIGYRQKSMLERLRRSDPFTVEEHPLIAESLRTSAVFIEAREGGGPKASPLFLHICQSEALLWVAIAMRIILELLSK